MYWQHDIYVTSIESTVKTSHIFLFKCHVNGKPTQKKYSRMIESLKKFNCGSCDEQNYVQISENAEFQDNFTSKISYFKSVGL